MSQASAMNQVVYKNTLSGCFHFTTGYLRTNKVKDPLKFIDVQVLQPVFNTSFLSAKALVFYTHRSPTSYDRWGAVGRVIVGHLFKAMFSKYLSVVCFPGGGRHGFSINRTVHKLTHTHTFMFKNRINPLHGTQSNILTSVAVFSFYPTFVVTG